MLSLFSTIFSGALATALFPPFDLWPLVVVAITPLFSAVWGKDGREAFRLGWIFGLIYFGFLLWWLAPTISRFGSMPMWAACPVIGLLVCYLALFPAVWAGSAAFLSSCLSSRMFTGLVLALLWGGLEWLRGWMLSGFPWGALSYALASQPLLFQSADLWGPYATGSVLIFLNFLLWDIRVHMKGGVELPPVLINLCLVMFICGISAFYGVIRYRDVTASDMKYPEIRVAAIQGSMAQDIKWEPRLQLHSVELYRKLTLRAVRGAAWEDAVAEGLDTLVVWPETSMPFFYQTGGELGKTVRNTAKEINGAILFGSPAFRTVAPGKRDYFNRAYLVNERGRITAKYDKMHLVPFGEYLPWGRLTSWARDLVPAAGDFTPGCSAAPLAWHRVRIGVLICFESIFPELAGKSVGLGANCLAVITNDSWFGDTGAPWQHAQMAAFRAVETRRWVIRAANTGVSEIISPTGQVVAKSSLFRQDIITGNIRLREDRTIYQRFGDTPFLLSVAVMIAAAVWLSRKGRRG